MHSKTKAIRIRVDQTNEMEHTTPLFLTSSFCFDTAGEMRAAFADETDDNIYSRFSNPNVQEFTDKVVALEDAEAGYATASGMSAVFGSFMALLKKGDHLLSCRALFVGGIQSLGVDPGPRQAGCIKKTTVGLTL